MTISGRLAPRGTLGALGDLIDFVGYQAMRFAVDPDGGLAVWRLCQAKDSSAALIEPVLQVLDGVLTLHLDVFRMGAGYGVGRRASDFVVNVHKQWHRIAPFLSPADRVRVPRAR